MILQVSFVIDGMDAGSSIGEQVKFGMTVTISVCDL